MKKTITLTDDQIVVLSAAIEMQRKELEKCIQVERERGDETWVSRYKKNIIALEQVKEKIGGAKWKL